MHLETNLDQRRKIFSFEKMMSMIWIFSHRQSLSPTAAEDNWHIRLRKKRGRLNQMIIHMVRHRPGMTLNFILFVLLLLLLSICERCDYMGVTATGREERKWSYSRHSLSSTDIVTHWWRECISLLRVLSTIRINSLCKKRRKKFVSLSLSLD